MKHRAKSNATSSSPTKSGKGGQKGKGKAGAGGASSSSSSAPIDLKDCPLSLADLTNSGVDHAQWVPRYHAVLRRSESDGVGLEDIDTLQLELEAMLATVVVRKATLKDELRMVGQLDKFRGKGQGSSATAAAGSRSRGGPGSPGKRAAASSASSSAVPSRESAKRFKAALKPSEAGAAGVGAAGKVLGLPKVKSDSSSLPHFDPLQNEQIRPLAESTQPKASLPKNETPNRFWAFVEPYCAPITPDDIKLLEDLLKTHVDMSEYFRIPPLGQHYTQRWAKEDLENERLKGASGNNGGGGTASSGGASDAAASAGDNKDSKDEVGRLLRKAESSVGGGTASSAEETPFGELTQRLVAGLMEENIMTAVEESMDANKSKGGGGDSDTENKSGLIKSLNINNADGLEARVRKELEEQGILDPSEEDGGVGAPAGEDNDEILEELKRCQSELKAVSAHNQQQLRRLLKAAKEEMVRQELRNKLAQADQEVMEAYQKISQARSKKKAPSKKERETAWKALKERDLILKELESV